MAVFRHSHYRYFWGKCYGNPSMGGKLVRTIGIVRATVKIGMQNLAYNMRRLVVLERSALAVG